MILRTLTPLAAILALAACKPAEAPPAPAPQEAPVAAVPVDKTVAPSGKVIPLSSEGFGALKIGMSEADADAAMKFTPGQASKDCHYRSPKDATLGLLVMFEEGMASSIRTSKDSTLKSDRAITLGMTEEAVRTAYSGGLEEEPHKYLKAPAKRLIHWDQKDLRGMLYEIDEAGKVISISAGGPSIRYVEGCS